MSFYMIEAIAWLGCRLFVDMVSQLDLEDKVSITRLVMTCRCQCMCAKYAGMNCMI